MDGVRDWHPDSFLARATIFAVGVLANAVGLALAAADRIRGRGDE